MKFTDLATNTVYFSEFFTLRFPEVYQPSKTNLEANGIKVKLIKGNQNIWCRDYMPVQVGERFVRFGYKGYGVGYEAYPWLIVPGKCFEPFQPLEVCSVILDGGGIVRNEKYAVITEIVFEQNPKLHKAQVVSRLEKALEVEVVIVPVEPGDTLGHTDGICKFVDDHSILVNDYSSVFKMHQQYRDYQEKLYRVLSSKFEVVPMPYAYELCPDLDDEAFYKEYPFADDNNPGFGYYINFLLTKTCILAPVFGIDKDRDAIKRLKKCYPDHSVVAIDCGRLSMEGGLSNCTTWNIIE